jgi:hypothetical protein
MRTWLAVSIAGLLALAVAPAGADVDVTTTYTKDKTIVVDETVVIDTQAVLIGIVVQEPTMAAEAAAEINQTNVGNEACENCAEKRDSITNSVSTNSGVVVVNEAAGNNNNQGSAISISVDRRIPPSEEREEDKEGGSFANAQAAVEQINAANVQDATNLEEKSSTIDASVNSNEGVVHVNQATGNQANQANALAMAVGFTEGGVSLAESDLGQVNILNTVNEGRGLGSEIGINKTATISGSVNSNAGVVGVNQSVGNMANQANVVSFAVVTGATITP